jgi:alkylhydroperoxidase/carboxymuconolactone decarboxylase family protein YurZ
MACHDEPTTSQPLAVVTRDELIELITHVAFYSCWPTVSTAIGIVREAFNDAPATNPLKGNDSAKA